MTAENWRRFALGDVARFTNGGAWKASEYVESGISVVRVSDIIGNSIDLTDCKFLPTSSYEKYKKHELFSGDLIIATVGSHPTQPDSVVGKPAIVPKHVEGALLNQNAVRIAPKDKRLDKRYLEYLGQSECFRNYIISNARGSANQVRMAITLLEKMEIMLPPLHIQRKISGILSCLDDLIEVGLRRIRTSEEIVKNLYTEWFVRFRFPGHENAKMINSEFGKIPEGWQVKKVKDLCSFVSRGVTPKYENGSGRYIINQKANRGLRIERSYLKELKNNLDVPEEKLAHRGDLLINSLGEGTIGRVHLFRGPHKEWAVDQHMAICRSEPHSITNYLYYELSSRKGQERIQSVKTGATNMTMLNISVLRSMEFIIPPKELLERFFRTCNSLGNLIYNLENKNYILTRIRDLLLPRLITDKIDVSGLDIQIPSD